MNVFMFTPRKLSIIFIVIHAFIVQGCSTTNTGGNISSSLRNVEIAYVEQNPIKVEAIPVIIHYPALVAPEASRTLAGAYGRKAVELPGEEQGTYKIATVTPYLKEAINKTEYLALELYRALVGKLPENSVVLAPQEVMVERGNLVAKTLNEYPPALVEVDLFAYRYPVRNPNIKAPQTFGDLASAFINIRTSFQASPATYGIITMNELFMKTNRPEFEQFFLSRGEKLKEGFRMTLVDYLGQAHKEPYSLELEIAAKLPRPANTLLVMPLQNISLDHDKIKKRGAHRDSPFNEVVKPYANIVVDSLNQLDAYRATRAKWQDYISNFDADLALKFPLKNVTRDEKVRLELMKKYAALERRFLAVKSQQHFAAAYNGDYGKAFRELLVSELDFVDRKRDQAQNENLLIFAATMQVLASAMAVASDQPTSVSATDQSQMEELKRMAIALGKEGQGLTAAFEKNFASIYSQHAQHQTMMLEGEKDIHVQTLSELREKLKEHYRRATANLPAVIALRSTAKTVGTDGPDWLQDPQSTCWLNRLSISADAVRWTGDCPSGKAEGYGLASFFTGTRYLGEYEGEMRDGLPNGWGVRIAPEADNSQQFATIEGHFEGGQPMGVVLVNRPGEKPRHEEFKAENESSKNVFAGLFGGAFGGPGEEAVAAFESERKNHQQQQVLSVMAGK